MSQSYPDTLPSLAAPAVLVVSCPAGLVSRCAEAVESLGLALQECGFLVAATIAAERRPLAIVMTEHVYDFDPHAFDALARDVGAALLRVGEDMGAPALELILEAAVEEAVRRRRRMADTNADPASAGGGDGRRTVPHPMMRAYAVGQRLPSRADLVAAAWKGRSSYPPPPSSRRGI